ncbi:unnamed protein product, partial [Rotaria sp. Silwood1]
MFGKAFAAVSAMCGIIGISFGINETVHDDGISLGTAAILGIIATSISLFSACVAIMIPINN